MMAAPFFVNGAQIVAQARLWLGTPFVAGAACQGAGTDCLGLVAGVFAQLTQTQISLPTYGTQWFTQNPQALEQGLNQYMLPVAPSEPTLGGHILAFRWRPHEPIGHLAIATSPNHIIHAHDGTSVCEVPLHSFWARKIAARYRYPFHLTQ